MQKLIIIISILKSINFPNNFSYIAKYHLLDLLIIYVFDFTFSPIRLKYNTINQSGAIMKKLFLFLSIITIALPIFAEDVAQSVRDGDKETLITLLKKGKNPNDVISNSLEEKNGLMIAADQMDLEMAKILIQYKADVNFKTPTSGTSALMYVATLYENEYNSTMEIAKLLIKSGADINAVDNNKWTPVMHAVYNAVNIPLIKYLLEQKPDLKKVNYEGNTALYIAALQGNAETADLLLKAGADSSQMKRENKFITAPIHYAAENGYIDFVRVLLENKADVNIKTKGGFGGMTPLHKAIESRDVDMVKLLLKYKADVNVKDDSGSSPLDYAHQGGGSELGEIIGLLKKAGAK